MIADSFSIGISVGEFWELSPFELYACYDGYQKKIEREYEQMADGAIMNRIAQHKKNFKRSDLIKPKQKIKKISGKGVDKSVWRDIDSKIESGELVFKKVGG